MPSLERGGENPIMNTKNKMNESTLCNRRFNTFFKYLLILSPFIVCSIICYYLQEHSSWISVLSCGLATTIAIYYSLTENRQSLNLEIKKEKASRIQQELANRFEKFSPNDLILDSLFSDLPSKEMSIEYKNMLYKQYSKCQELLVSAKLLYSADFEYPESKEFLKSYKDMIDFSSQLILALILSINNENKQNLKDSNWMYIFIMDRLFDKYNLAIKKANIFIEALNIDFKSQAQYLDLKMDNPLKSNNKDLEEISSEVKKSNEKVED